MDTQPLKLHVDSKQAQADLAALASALDRAGSAATKMKNSFATGMSGADASIKGAMASMEKFATVAGLLNKIKINGEGTKAIVEFSKAMSMIARSKDIEKSKLESYRKFIEVGAQVSRLKISGNAFAGIHAFTAAVDAAAKTRQVTPAKLKSWVDFIEVAARAQKLRFSPATAASLTSFAQAMESIGRVRSISSGKIAALKEFVNVLGSIKPMKYAQTAAKDLDHMAQSAARAGAAFATLPPKMRGIGPAASASAAGADKLNRSLNMTPAAANKASQSLGGLGKGLEHLNNRFNLTYQAGTIFTSLFSTFTIGAFVRGIYDTSISMQKLEKAMLFTTGSFEEAKTASSEYLAIADRLGMRALQNADAYSRFAISGKAVGATLQDVNKIFSATGMALTSVGASGQQWEYAMYGLSQAMAKGKITSEEFNRQIGEQIPGNVAAGVRALSRLEGKQLTANDLFDRMKAGAIQSLPFLRLWADEIEKMFAPLLPVAEKRPDFQLNRLMNVWDRFKVSVGNNGFMGELTTQFKRLADVFMEGEGAGAKLNERGETLARTFGKNLGDMVRKAGDAMMWLADNMDTVLAAIKGLLALSVVSTLNGWANSLANYTTKQIQATAANFGLAKSEQAKAAATGQANMVTNAATQVTTAKAASQTAANASAFAAGAVGSRTREGGKTGLMGPSLFGLANEDLGDNKSRRRSVGELRRMGFNAEDAAFYGAQATRRNPKFTAQSGELFGNPGTRTAPEFGRRVPVMAGVNGAAAAAEATKSASSMAGAANIAKGAFVGLRGVINMLPGVAMAAGIALAVFSEKMTGIKTKAGNEVLVKDVAGGAFNVVAGDIGASVAEAAKGFEALFGVANGKISGMSLGDWLAWIAAGFITVGRAIFTAAESLGKVIGEIISGMILDIIAMGQTVAKVAQLDFRGAGRVMQDRQKAKGESVRDLVKELGSDWSDALDMRGTYERIRGGAETAADRRGQADEASAQARAAEIAIEAALKTREAADKQAAAAADLAAAARDFRGNAVPDYATIRADLEALRTGGLTSAERNRPAAAATPAATPVAAAAGTPESVLDTEQRSEISRALYANARALTGMRENNPGDRNSLKTMFAGAGIPLDPAKDAWCAAFINALLAAQGAPQSGGSRVRASDFKNYGEEVSMADAQQGDIVVLKPQSRGASGHVGLFDGRNANGSVRLLGGNQGDQVKVSSFAASEVVSVRRAPTAAEAAIGPSGAPTRPGDAAAAAPDEGQHGTLTERRQNNYTRLKAIAGQSSAAAQIEASTLKDLETIDDIIKFETDLRQRSNGGNVGYELPFTDEDLKALDRWQEIQMKAFNDALNPLGKMNRLAESNLRVQTLASQGRADEAAWLEQINNLTEENFDFSKVNLDLEKQRFMAAEQRKRQLEAEVDLTRTLNDITMEQIGRTGSRRDMIMADLISQSANPGESFGNARTRLMGDDKIAGSINQQVDAIDKQASLGAQQDILRDLVEQQQMAGLTGRERSQRDDFKTYLEALTGTVGTLDELLANADDSTESMARRMMEAKDALENPPGFKRWVQGLEPLAERLEQIKGDFMDSLGSGLTDALMGEDVDWREIGRDISKKVLRAQVDNMLANVVNLFGGKPAATLTPEQQALISVSEQMRLEAARASEATVVAASTSAEDLTGAAGALSTAAADLTGTAGILARAVGITSVTDPSISSDPIGDLISETVAPVGAGDRSYAGLYAEAGLTDPNAPVPTDAASVVTAASTSADALALSTAENTAAMAILTETLIAMGAAETAAASVPAADPIGDLIAKTASTGTPAAAAAAPAAQGGGNFMKTLGSMIQTGITASMNYLPKNFQSSSAFGNSLELTPGETKTSKFAGITSALKNLTAGMGGGGAGGGAGGGIGGFFSNLFGGGGAGGAGGGGIGGFFSNLFGGGAGGAATGGAGGGIGGFFSSLMGAGGAGGGLGGMLGGLFGGGGAGGAGGAGGGLGGMLGGMFGGGMMSPLGLLGSLFLKKKDKKPEDILKPINGVIGEHRAVNVTGTSIAAHSNPIADILNMGLNMFTGGMFKEGGYSNSPVQRTHLSSNINWSAVPHYAEGTANTSGGMPAMLHPNEAVIPLSRGRKIPVELGESGGGGGGGANINTNITVVAPNPDAFRKSTGSIQRQTNRDLKRAAVRNLG